MISKNRLSSPKLMNPHILRWMYPTWTLSVKLKSALHNTTRKHQIGALFENIIQ